MADNEPYLRPEGPAPIIVTLSISERLDDLSLRLARLEHLLHEAFGPHSYMVSMDDPTLGLDHLLRIRRAGIEIPPRETAEPHALRIKDAGTFRRQFAEPTSTDHSRT